MKKKNREKENASDSEAKEKILERKGKITEIDENCVIIKADKSNMRKHSGNKTPPSKIFNIIYFIQNF